MDDVPSLPNEVATLDGDPITLLCGENLNGNPTPLVEWRDSANILVLRDLGSRYTFSDGPAEVSLTIDSTVNSDTGNWTCTVSVTGPGGEEPRPPIVRTISVFIVGRLLPHPYIQCIFVKVWLLIYLTCSRPFMATSKATCNTG